MRRQLMGFAVAVAAVMLTAWSKPLKEMITTEKTTNKSISFDVYKANSYSSAVYNDASASLQVTVIKVKGNERCVVWQKNYNAMLLKQYPCAANAINYNVLITNVDDRKEYLEAIYTLTYNSKGSTVQLQDGKVIAKGAQNEKLLINI